MRDPVSRFAVALIAAVGLAALMPASIATATLDGPCEAQAAVTADDGTAFEAINPRTKTGVYTVPIAGSASYTGSIAVQPPPEGRAISGSVSVALPLGGSITIKSWSDDASTTTSDAGTVTWDLPAVTPRGIEMSVSGSHSDLQDCSGAITVKLDGGLTDSMSGIASLILTLIAGAGLLFAGVPRP